MCASPDSPIAAPEGQTPEREVSRQLTLRGMLVSTSIFGAILGGALRFGSPALVINCVLAEVAVIVWRIARLSVIGMVLAVLGVQAAVGVGFEFCREPNVSHATELFVALAAILLASAIPVFFFAGDSERPGARRNWVAAIVCVAGSLIAGLVVPTLLRSCCGP